LTPTTLKGRQVEEPGNPNETRGVYEEGEDSQHSKGNGHETKTSARENLTEVLTRHCPRVTLHIETS